MIIFINQKISLINNHVVSIEKDKNKDRKVVRTSIVNIINDTIGYVEETKTFIEDKWNL